MFHRVDQMNENNLSDETNSAASPITSTLSKTARTSLVCYGPIRIRRRHTVSSTLATGRRSKDDFIQGEDPTKRELRRLKNREAARRLKAERDGIERDLLKQVTELEHVERTLLNEIDELKLNKSRLEHQFDQCIYYYEEFLRRNSHALIREREQQLSSSTTRSLIIPTKQEPRSPSPQWQLLFHI